MTPELLLTTAIQPASDYLRARFTIGEADTFSLAIALQESGLRHRRQVVGGEEKGPAVSWWQFEAGGGVRGVMEHTMTRAICRAVCDDFGIQFNQAQIWTAMQWNDVFAACMARLNILQIPSKLPQTAEEGWAQYKNQWRPGQPHPEVWCGNWNTAAIIIDRREKHE